MQVRDSYDLVIIGDQLSGLFLAAGAGQMGLKVLVLQDTSVPTVSYEQPSGRLLGDFSPEPVIGLQEGSAADGFLRSLGLYENLDELFPRHNPPMQVVGDRFRFDFSYNAAAMNAELAREFPSSPGVSRLLSGEPLEKGAFSEVVAKAGLPVDFEIFGWLQAACYGALAPRDLSYPGYKEILSLAARGVRYPLGGRSALTENLMARIRAFGGAIKKNTRVEEIVFERGRLAGVLLSSYEGFVRSPLVVGAMGTGTFFHLIPKEFQSSALREAVKRIHPRFWRFSFTLLLPEDALPEGMGSHLALVDGEDFLQVQTFPSSAYGGIPARHRAVVVRTLIPFEPATIAEKSVQRHLKRCLTRLKKVMPFLDEMPIQVSPDPGNLAGDITYQRYYRFKDLDFIPPVYLAYESGLSAALDQREFLDWKRFGLPGLAICSRDVYPLFGATGEILAAMDMLAVLKKAGK
jgi:hypothetical protein